MVVSSFLMALLVFAIPSIAAVVVFLAAGDGFSATWAFFVVLMCELLFVATWGAFYVVMGGK